MKKLFIIPVFIVLGYSCCKSKWINESGTNIQPDGTSHSYHTMYNDVTGDYFYSVEIRSQTGTLIGWSQGSFFGDWFHYEWWGSGGAGSGGNPKEALYKEEKIDNIIVKGNYIRISKEINQATIMIYNPHGQILEEMTVHGGEGYEFSINQYGKFFVTIIYQNRIITKPIFIGGAR